MKIFQLLNYSFINNEEIFLILSYSNQIHVCNCFPFIIKYVENTTLVKKPLWGRINIDVVSRCDVIEFCGCLSLILTNNNQQQVQQVQP